MTKKTPCMNCGSIQEEKDIKYLGDSKWICPNCNNKCIRCGEEAEVETEQGYLCEYCDFERLSCINNPDNPKTEEDFWKENEQNDKI